jgi:hypothetical protein
MKANLKFRNDARELASIIVNRWETDKDFNSLVLVVEEFLIDLDSTFNSQLEQLSVEMKELREKIECLST